MKKDKNTTASNKEDDAARNKRRENYARTRDLQALDFNEAIAKRKDLKDRNLVKCEKCGKEFEADLNSKEPLICPDCR
jgi:predicted Zn-ribbon and HTH transcriptional regulator